MTPTEENVVLSRLTEVERVLKDNAETMHQIKDILTTIKGISTVCKWLVGFAAAVAAVIHFPEIFHKK